jgi:two-component system, OmpR family, sensor kinase
MKPIEENNTRLKEYNHNLAHEIKTPLTVMTLNLGIIENDQNQAIIESTKEEIFKIKNITDTLLFLSENFVVKKKQSVSLSFIIESFIQKHQDKENIEFLLKDKDIETFVDVHMFERLLKNLIENALKYSSDKKICITLQRDKILFTNHVANNVDISRLLDMFFQ